ncbi:hypothetical protein ACQZ61_06515 [Agrobacterium vitis]|uniref:hypothetical protein n=1 Tax=Agrobacterium vitis TaxID=373 RepID=UPI0015DB2C22|nr:hypothetical protein [Agrobacterium vitis]MCF1454097.1 hypothetical protein [Agrobacterium vitis]BCH55258.1 hypothetical protein RvVAR031_28680 [Agrobacterium vitis]
MSLTDDIAQLVARTNALLATFEAKEAAISAAVQAAINGAGSLYREVWVDPTKGNDANTGLTATTAFLTLDRAIEATAQVPSVTISLLGDVTLRKRISTHSTALTIRGMDGVNERNRPVRKISFAPLASNSPNVYFDTYPAGIDLNARVALRTDGVSIAIPDVPSTTSSKNVFSVYFGVNFSMQAGVLSADAAATAAVLFGTWWVSPVEIWFANVQIADSAKGHILGGVAAGGNPNSVTNYRSNATAL